MLPFWVQVQPPCQLISFAQAQELRLHQNQLIFSLACRLSPLLFCAPHRTLIWHFVIRTILFQQPIQDLLPRQHRCCHEKQLLRELP
jgi:hypothetical protein